MKHKEKLVSIMMFVPKGEHRGLVGFKDMEYIEFPNGTLVIADVIENE